MKIAWYDHGLLFQSSAIPCLPLPEETFMVYDPDTADKHHRTSVVGMELWRVPLLHRLLDDGHHITMLTQRKVAPDPRMDDDLARLVEYHPEFRPYVRDRDPALDIVIDTRRQRLNVAYAEAKAEHEANAESETYVTDMYRKWLREDTLGPIPDDVDLFVCAVMRSDLATAGETTYFLTKFIRAGVPVILWDQDNQMSSLVSNFNRVGLDWPNNLCTVIAPYSEPTKHATPELIDYPYGPYIFDPASVEERREVVYAGNDYGRREAMAKFLLHLPDTCDIPVRVFGRYAPSPSSKKKDEWVDWTQNFPSVNWMGPCPANQVPRHVRTSLFTVNIVKEDYKKLGLITLRTFDSNAYGTLQIADGTIKRIEQYVPKDYLVYTRDDAIKLAKKIRAFSDPEYQEELARQRELTSLNDFDHFSYRFYDIVDRALKRAGRQEGVTIP